MAKPSLRAWERRARERNRIEAAAHREAVKSDGSLPQHWLNVLTGVHVAGYLAELSLPCCVVSETNRNLWRTIWSTDLTIVALEILHGVHHRRAEYNERCFNRVVRTRRPLVASYGGFYDLFVPLLERGRVVGFLANGPFGRKALTPEDIREQWLRMTGRPALARDPQFLRYAALALDTPLLDGRELKSHVEYMRHVAKALAGTEDLPMVRRRQRPLDKRVRKHRRSYGMWELARGLTDPGGHGFWAADFRVWHRTSLGLSRLPNVVITIARPSERDEDPLQALVASRRFAERCSEASLGFPETICGRAGQSTPYFLTSVDPTLSARNQRREIQGLLERARTRLGREPKAELRFGVSQTIDPRALPRCLDEAMVALEWATHEQRPEAYYADEARRQAEARPLLFRSFDDIVTAVRRTSGPSRLLIAIDRLMSEVAWRAGPSVAAARAYVETLFAQLVHVVRRDSLLEPRVLVDRVAAFHAVIDEATSVRALTQAFHQHVVAVHDALRRPEQAEREAKVSRAARYIENHMERALPLKEVARVAGYAPDYFSRLFHDLYGMTFEHWLLSLRLARAKELLRTTALGVNQVASACGFGSVAYFYRAFHDATGTTPKRFRELPSSRFSKTPLSPIADKATPKHATG